MASVRGPAAVSTLGSALGADDAGSRLGRRGAVGSGIASALTVAVVAILSLLSFLFGWHLVGAILSWARLQVAVTWHLLSSGIGMTVRLLGALELLAWVAVFTSVSDLLLKSVQRHWRDSWHSLWFDEEDDAHMHTDVDGSPVRRNSRMRGAAAGTGARVRAFLQHFASAAGDTILVDVVISVAVLLMGVGIQLTGGDGVFPTIARQLREASEVSEARYAGAAAAAAAGGGAAAGSAAATARPGAVWPPTSPGAIGNDPAAQALEAVASWLELGQAVALYGAVLAMQWAIRAGIVAPGAGRSARTAANAVYVLAVAVLYMFQPHLQATPGAMSALVNSTSPAANGDSADAGAAPPTTAVWLSLPAFLRLVIVNPLPCMVVGLVGLLPALLVKYLANRHIDKFIWRVLVTYAGSAVAALWATRMGAQLAALLASQSLELQPLSGDLVRVVRFVLLAMCVGVAALVYSVLAMAWSKRALTRTDWTRSLRPDRPSEMANRLELRELPSTVRAVRQAATQLWNALNPRRPVRMTMRVLHILSLVLRYVPSMVRSFRRPAHDDEFVSLTFRWRPTVTNAHDTDLSMEATSLQVRRRNEAPLGLEALGLPSWFWGSTVVAEVTTTPFEVKARARGTNRSGVPITVTLRVQKRLLKQAVSRVGRLHPIVADALERVRAFFGERVPHRVDLMDRVRDAFGAVVSVVLGATDEATADGARAGGGGVNGGTGGAEGEEEPFNGDVTFLIHGSVASLVVPIATINRGALGGAGVSAFRRSGFTSWMLRSVEQYRRSLLARSVRVLAPDHDLRLQAGQLLQQLALRSHNTMAAVAASKARDPAAELFGEDTDDDDYGDGGASNGAGGFGGFSLRSLLGGDDDADAAGGGEECPADAERGVEAEGIAWLLDFFGVEDVELALRLADECLFLSDSVSVLLEREDVIAAVAAAPAQELANIASTGGAGAGNASAPAGTPGTPHRDAAAASMGATTSSAAAGAGASASRPAPAPTPVPEPAPAPAPAAGPDAAAGNHGGAIASGVLATPASTASSLSSPVTQAHHKRVGGGFSEWTRRHRLSLLLMAEVVYRVVDQIAAHRLGPVDNTGRPVSLSELSSEYDVSRADDDGVEDDEGGHLGAAAGSGRLVPPAPPPPLLAEHSTSSTDSFESSDSGIDGPPSAALPWTTGRACYAGARLLAAAVSLSWFTTTLGHVERAGRIVAAARRRRGGDSNASDRDRDQRTVSRDLAARSSLGGGASAVRRRHAASAHGDRP